MRLTGFAKVAGALLVCLGVSATASAQYGGGSGGSTGTGGAGTGMPGTHYSYGNGKAIGIGVGAAAAAGVGIALLVHHHHKSAAKAEQALTGCTESVMNQLTLRNEQDNQSYTLLTGGINLQPGQRVEVKGVPAKEGSAENAFHVRALVNNYGGCGSTSAATAAQPAVHETKEVAQAAN